MIEPDVSTEPSIEHASHTYREGPLVHTRGDAVQTPQVDRMGRKKMFDMLRRLLADRPLELAPATSPTHDDVIVIESIFK